MTPLPPRQSQLLAFIDKTLKEKRRFPKAHEMATHMDWKDESYVYEYLHKLIYRGEIRIVGEGKPRKYERVVREKVET